MSGRQGMDLSKMGDKKTGLMIAVILALAVVVSLNFASALTPTVCCEKTISGLSCQDVPADQCAPGVTPVATSCRSTSFCKPGTCFDSNEGTCLDNTPQIVCNENKGIWQELPVPQCQLGCCVLGDQAAFVTLTRCKKLSASLGLQTNYKKEITNEVQCILSVQNLEKGACVYTSGLATTCKFTTREECGTVAGEGVNNKTKGGQFYVGKLCSAEELGTNCGWSQKTMCVPGKEEIYFVDSCGNPANIYDATKINDKEYWTNVKDKSAVCNPNSGNANSQSCGNCNYLLGSFCRDSSKAGGAKPSYGTNICADLNCKDTANGKSYKHGESWCVYDDEGGNGNSNNAVGSRFYKHICENGEEVLEQCADYRQHECIQDSIQTTAGAFSQAACRVNRWQDCSAQTEISNCENSDRRDCVWKVGKCVPKNTPGLKFWSGSEAKSVCGRASVECEATGSEGLIGSAEWKGDCVKSNGDIDQSWVNKQLDICMAMGDCGPKINWVGDKGYPNGKGQVGYSVEED